MTYPLIPRLARVRQGRERRDPVADLKLSEAGGSQPPAPARPSSALGDMLAANENFKDREWQGGSSGAMLPPPTPAPPSAPAHEFTIEPPPWQHRLESGDLDLDALGPSERQPAELAALDQMKLADAQEPKPWQPAVTTPAMPPVRVPEPDWEAEEAQRARDPAPLPAEPPDPPFVPPPPPWSAPKGMR